MEKYNPIIVVDISPMYTGVVGANVAINVIKELILNKCRVIVLCPFVSTDRIQSFLKSNDIDVLSINSPLECTSNALGNTVNQNYIYRDYTIVLKDDNTNDVKSAISIDNFYICLYEFEDGSHIGFKHGQFDDWCIDFHTPDGKVINPRDEYYFSRLLKIADKFDCYDQIYSDFVDIYDVCTECYDKVIMDIIVEMSNRYGDCATIFRNCMAMIYAGMIAEENKKNAILKRRVKRLGMYQVFVERMNVTEAARYSAGMNWRDLDVVMKKYGF